MPGLLFLFPVRSFYIFRSYIFRTFLALPAKISSRSLSLIGAKMAGQIARPSRLRTPQTVRR
jgi:hypothetical protein